MKIKRTVFIILLLLVAILTAKVIFYPSLNSVTLDGADKVREIPSPDHNYKLNIYLYGGVFLKWDYSYIGELENVKTSEKKNILWLPPDTPNIQWLDSKTLVVGEENVIINKDIIDLR